MIARVASRTALVLAVTLVAGCVQAATDQPLAALVPADVGLCLEAQDLATHLDELSGSELGQRLMKYPPVAEKLAKVAGELHKMATALKLSDEQLRDGLLGAEGLLAIWPPDAPGGEPPLLLVIRAKQPAVLRRVFTAMVSGRRKDARFEPAHVEVAGESLEIHKLPGKTRDSIVHALMWRDLAIVSTRQELAGQVIKQAKTEKADNTLLENAAYRDAQQHVRPGACIRAFLNPRPWDALMLAKTGKHQANFVQSAVLAAWEASQYLAMSVEIGTKVHSSLYLACRADSLPNPLRSAVKSLMGQAELAQHTPQGTVAGACLRLDLHRLVDGLLAVHDRELSPGQHNLSSALPLALASKLGPNAGLFLLEPEAGARPDGWPVQWAAAIETQPRSDAPALAASLVEMLATTLEVAAKLRPSTEQPERAKTATEQEPGVFVIDSLPGLEPGQKLALAAKGRFVWLASSPKSLERAAAGDVDMQPIAGRRPSAVVWADLRRLQKVAEAGLLGRTGSIDALRPLGFLSLADRAAADYSLDAEGLELNVEIDTEP